MIGQWPFKFVLQFLAQEKFKSVGQFLDMLCTKKICCIMQAFKTNAKIETHVTNKSIVLEDKTGIAN